MSDTLRPCWVALRTCDRRVITDRDLVRVLCCQQADRWVASSAAMDIARRARFDGRRRHEVSVIAGELAANALRHAGGGLLELRLAEPSSLAVACHDAGPGIRNVAHVLASAERRWFERAAADLHPDGFGTGFGAILRLADDLALETVVGAGTTVRAVVRAR